MLSANISNLLLKKIKVLNMKILIIFTLILISTNSCAQNKTETIIRDGNGKIINSENKDINQNNLNETLELFYNKIDDSKNLDNLLSFRFYQKMPYNKFKEFTIEKAKKVGKFKTKEVIKEEFSPDKNAVKYLLKVNYENEKTNEELILIKENEKDNFKIYDYNYKIL